MPGPLPASALIPGHAEREERARWPGGGAGGARMRGRGVPAREPVIAKRGSGACLLPNRGLGRPP